MDKRQAVPSNLQRQKAKEAIYTKWPKRPDKREALSKRASEILDYIAEGKVKKGGALHYELLWEVYECGAVAGSAASALAALDDLCATFKIERFPQYVDLLTKLGKRSRKDDEAAQRLISGRARWLFLDALTNGNVDGADVVLSLVRTCKQAVWWLRRAREARHDFDTLKRDPDDARANLAVATYFLAERGDWHAAQPYLQHLKAKPLRRALGPKSASLAPLELSRELSEAASQIRQHDRRTSDRALLADFLYERAVKAAEQSMHGVKDMKRMELEKALADLRKQADAPRKYLFDFKEDAVRKAPLEGGFDKGGHVHNAKEVPLKVAGVHYERSILLHAAKDGHVYVRYKLKGGRWRWLRGLAAISDSASGRRKKPTGSRSRGVITFEVFVNGRHKWRSQRVQFCGESSPFCVDISSCRTLELRITCVGPNNYAHTVWADPYLLK